MITESQYQFMKHDAMRRGDLPELARLSKIAFLNELRNKKGYHISRQALR